MLPLLAPLLFALLGLAALVIDGGLALGEQARLELQATMVAEEWSQVRDWPSAVRPAACRALPPGSEANERCLRSALLVPMLEPLDPGAAQLADGAARLGDVATSGILSAAPALEISRSSPTIFGRAALPGRGPRARGFELEAVVELDPSGAGAPALRVSPLPLDLVDAAGAVGIAWRLDALDALAAALANPNVEATIDLGEAWSDPAFALRFDGAVAGCLFDPGVVALNVGDRLAPANPSPASLPRAIPLPLAVAYLPVVETCDGPIVGFLAVSLTGSHGGSPDRIVLRPSSGRARVRNASTSLNGPAAARRAAEAVFSSPLAARLLADGAPWSAYVARVPRGKRVERESPPT